MEAECIVGSPTELARWFVADLERAIRAVPPSRQFTLAVPGGSVAETFFPQLVASGIPWQRVDVLWVDERAVPPDSPESNYGLATRLWLQPAGVPPRNIHRMPADEADLPRAAEEYARMLCSAAGSPPQLDYVLLGVGSDGHVASIFGHPGADHVTEPVTWTDLAPKPPPRRMSLSLGTLAGARRVVIAAFDASKSTVIGSAVHAPDALTPLARLLRSARAPVLLLGPEAAAEACRPR